MIDVHYSNTRVQRCQMAMQSLSDKGIRRTPGSAIRYFFSFLTTMQKSCIQYNHPHDTSRLPAMKNSFSPLHLLFFIFLLGIMTMLFQAELLSFAFVKLGLPPEMGLTVLFLSLFGSVVNLPVARIKSDAPPRESTSLSIGDCSGCRRSRFITKHKSRSISAAA